MTAAAERDATHAVAEDCMSEPHTGRHVPRRSFLAALAGLGLGGAVLAGSAGRARATAVRGAGAPGDLSLDRMGGVQLYTVGDLMRQDFDGTIERVAQVGYKHVEFAGYFGRTPEQVRAVLDRVKLTSPSAHIPMDLLRTDLDAQVHAAQVIGQQYITVPSLGRTETPMTTADAWKRTADEFNRLGSTLKGRGLNLAFHSHSGEFLDVGGGKTGMDVFIAGTDPSLVTFEIDLLWARVAGQDPVAWFNRYPGRFKMWHVKDMRDLKAAQARQAAAFQNPGAPRPAGEGRAGEIAPVGAGDIDFRPIFAQWQRAGLQYFFVEHDGAQSWPGGSLASIATSYTNLRGLLA